MNGNISNLQNIVLLTGPLDYVVRDTDNILNIDTTLGVVNITLPNIKNSGLDLYPRIITVNDIAGNANINNITILPSGGDSINSAPNAIISVAGGSVKCAQANNIEWFVAGPGLPVPTGDANYVFTQSSPSDTWTVNHNLDKRCSVQVVGDDFKEVVADITWVSNNTVLVEFNTATTGYVYCN